jgi:hypothetical protein
MGYLSSGLNSDVNALVYDYSGKIIAGGNFTNARYGPVLNYVGKWDPVVAAWSPLGSGTDNQVYAVRFYRGDIIAGGAFINAGGTVVNHIAKWNGTAWSSLGNGVGGNVYALAVYNDKLIVGGNFTTVGGLVCPYIAAWNGNYWSYLGSGFNHPVWSLEPVGTYLIAGGNFTQSGTSSLNHIAKWDGTSWTPLGSGTNDVVYALSHSVYWDSLGVHTILTAGGGFTTAGGAPANYIAQWIETDTIVKGKVFHRNLINKQIVPHSVTLDTVYQGDNNPSSLYLHGLTITIDTLNYPYDSDLEFYLIHQSMIDTIIYHAGGSGANFTGTILDSSGWYPITYAAAPCSEEYIPVQSLNVFNNLDPTGTWILKVYNNGNSTGTLEAWSLTVAYGFSPIGIRSISSGIPKSFQLFQNYPNPFNPITKFKIQITKLSNAKVTVYDVLGREVATLINEQLKPGTYEVTWDASNYPSGVYFYKLVVGDNTNNGEFTETKKMVLVK